jgi:hypothetical protein
MRKKSLLATASSYCWRPAWRLHRSAQRRRRAQPRPRIWPKSSAAHTAAATAAAEAAAKTKYATRLVLILRGVEFRSFDAPPVGGAEGPGDTTLATFDAFTQGGRRVGHTEARFTAQDLSA